MSCNGEFFNTAPDGPFVPVVDMTLVLGDEAPTTVTPLAGQTGVEATWGGNVGVTYALTRNLELDVRYHATDANVRTEQYADAVVAGLSIAF